MITENEKVEAPEEGNDLNVQDDPFASFESLDFDQELKNADEVSYDDEPQFQISEPHMLIPKAGIGSFLKLSSVQRKLGSDSYSKSVKVRRKDSGTLELTYYNGMSFATQDLKVNTNDNPITREYVIALDSLIKVLSFGPSQVPVLEKDEKLYAFLFGGRVFIEVQEIAASYYSEFKVAGALESEFELDAETFLATLRALYPLITSSARAEERCIYLTEEAAYVYSGVVIGAFAGRFAPIALQHVDAESLIQFFSGYTGAIKLKIFSDYLVFSTRDRSLTLARKSLVLEENLKIAIKEPSHGVSVNATALFDILNILSNLPQNSGVVSFLKTETGLTIESPQRTGSEISTFPLQACQIGDGVKSNLKVPVRSIKDYLRAFSNNVTLGIVDDRLTIYGDGRILEISGTRVDKQQN